MILPNGTDNGPKKKTIHRVRLSDQEIEYIGKGLGLLYDVKEQEFKAFSGDYFSPQYKELRFLGELVRRFQVWGNKDYESPFFARPRR